MPTSSPEDLYGVIERHRLGDDRLPTSDELDDVASALGAVQEFMTSKIWRGCNAVSASGTPNEASYEDIGRLVCWADYVRLVAERIIEDAERAMIVARTALVPLASGNTNDGASYEHGVPVHDESYLRNHGFARTRSSLAEAR